MSGCADRGLALSNRTVDASQSARSSDAIRNEFARGPQRVRDRRCTSELRDSRCEAIVQVESRGLALQVKNEAPVRCAVASLMRRMESV